MRIGFMLTLACGVGLVACGEQASEPAVEATDLEPAAVEATDLEPAAVEATDLEPAAVEATDLEPAAVEATDLEPAAVEATDLEPAAVEAMDLEPAAVEATDLEPAAVEATDLEPAAEPEAALPRTPAPEGATVYIIAPADGDEVTNPVNVLFGLSGGGIAPAGVEFAGSGHHHMLVDTGAPAENLPIPTDANHVHFGLGQTETMVDLAPGEHTLQLLLGDYLHIPHDPPLLSERIAVTVVE